jgi:endonuclease/exonuclease/phosphatase family metal-dependent hydrolase
MCTPVRITPSVSFWFFSVFLGIGVCLATGALAQQPAAQQAEEPVADASRTLRLLAYNIKHGHGNDGKVDLSRSAEVIRRLNPDLVALQEVDNRCQRSGMVDQASQLGETTGMRSLFGKFFDFQGGEYGMATLAKFKWTDATNLRLPRGAEPRFSLVTTIHPWQDGPAVTVANVHFYSTLEQRMAQARRLLDELARREGPAIVMGDFNSTPDSPVLELFADEWLIPDKGPDRLTFSSDRPRVEIDYIVLRPRAAWRVIEIDVIDEPVVSDHRPVLAEVEFRREGQ